MRWPWQSKPIPPAVEQARSTIEEAAKATDEAGRAVDAYWAARVARKDYAYAERRRIERRHK